MKTTFTKMIAGLSCAFAFCFHVNVHAEEIPSAPLHFSSSPLQVNGNFANITYEPQAVFINSIRSKTFNLNFELTLQEDNIFTGLPPFLASTIGFSMSSSKGWSGFVRHSYVDIRTANSPYTTVTNNFIPIDVSVQYSFDRFLVGVSAENILNSHANIVRSGLTRNNASTALPVDWSPQMPEMPYTFVANFCVSF